MRSSDKLFMSELFMKTGTAYSKLGLPKFISKVAIQKAKEREERLPSESKVTKT